MKDSAAGKEIPSLKLTQVPGGEIELPKAFKGRWTLLYFYPKDDTPGCTKQACTYQENIDKFTKAGVQVLGVSLDDLASHKQFQAKYSLQFPLLSDSDHKLSEFLGVYGDQEWKGKVYTGLSRDTFLINPEAKVEMVWRKVDPTTTVNSTFEAVQSIVNKNK